MNSQLQCDGELPFSPGWYAQQQMALGEFACRQLGFYVIPPEFRLSVVIPVYNEEKTLRQLVDRVRSVPIRKELILVDDCSRDRSREVLQQLEQEGGSDDMNRIRIFFHDTNQGHRRSPWSLRTHDASILSKPLNSRDVTSENRMLSSGHERTPRRKSRPSDPPSPVQLVRYR